MWFFKSWDPRFSSNNSELKSLTTFSLRINNKKLVFMQWQNKVWLKITSCKPRQGFQEQTSHNDRRCILISKAAELSKCTLNLVEYKNPDTLKGAFKKNPCVMFPNHRCAPRHTQHNYSSVWIEPRLVSSQKSFRKTLVCLVNITYFFI